ncbi:histidine phosphotransferase family protein [Sphingorhabdus wooponensis]|jgi:histidine phosphotransferase ChpT|uniref:Histidine phosphotransferase n=1 Tax=Sphingorhabdus wooponensis TaxID=940136 RepID=A0A426RSU2_9SPHN|nr:histidine phosphotransferase family protein [Sphingorhabdus wooponensis]RRQ52044.1 histidine phosphotransferase [Sphingorhabdus wooponensis]
MPDTEIDFASLLCSRLCHDLLSPVGAMNNGIELLADEHDPEMRRRCMDLLAESAKSAADKLKFFRLAFGAAGGFGAEVDPNEAKLVIAPMVTASGRTVLEWAVPADAMPKRAVKILLNLVLLANEALARGGTLFVGAEARAGEHEIVVRASGPKILMDSAVREALTGQLDPAAVDTRTAAAWMAHKLAVQDGGMLQLSESDDAHLVIGALLRI